MTEPAYTLSDMASDSIAILDHLGVRAAHLVGASMGGMIAQTIARTWTIVVQGSEATFEALDAPIERVGPLTHFELDRTASGGP